MAPQSTTQGQGENKANTLLEIALERALRVGRVGRLKVGLAWQGARGPIRASLARSRVDKGEEDRKMAAERDEEREKKLQARREHNFRQRQSLIQRWLAFSAGSKGSPWS